MRWARSFTGSAASFGDNALSDIAVSPMAGFHRRKVSNPIVAKQLQRFIMSAMNELLTPEEMYRADAAAVAAGVTSLTRVRNDWGAGPPASSGRLEKGRRVLLYWPWNNGGAGGSC